MLAQTAVGSIQESKALAAQWTDDVIHCVVGRVAGEDPYNSKEMPAVYTLYRANCDEAVRQYCPVIYALNVAFDEFFASWREPSSEPASVPTP